ncbi:SLBB domain-containing protein, partial [Streptomyces sp. NPDC002920]
MALRSRSRTRIPHATSGPGRGLGSDSRVRPRRPPGPGRVRQRPAPATELRRRAEVLFAARDEDGPGPPSELPDAPSPPPPREGAPPGDWRERAGAALRERLPVWVQARCGMERGSVLALTAVLVVAAVFAVQHFWTGRTQPVRAPEVVRAAAPYDVTERKGTPEPTASAGAGVEIVVDVGGKVRRPGIKRLPAGSRVVDALSAAGGVRPGTNTDGLNRARFLVDGEQVVVGGPAPPTAAAVGGAAAGPAAPVSLNTATVEQ